MLDRPRTCTKVLCGPNMLQKFRPNCDEICIFWVTAKNLVDLSGKSLHVPSLGYHPTSYSFSVLSRPNRNKFRTAVGQLSVLNDFLFRCQIFLLVFNHDDPKVTRIASRGQILDFFTPAKFVTGMGEMSEWSLHAAPAPAGMGKMGHFAPPPFLPGNVVKCFMHW